MTFRRVGEIMGLFIPNEVHKTIFDIDLVQLYESGKRLILTDLDNTLVSYKDVVAPKAILEFKDQATAVGFDVCILSNNATKRVEKFAESLGVEFFASAKKPLKRTFKRAVKEVPANEVVMIGDQLLTDILGGNRMGFYTILVDVIDYKTEGIGTRINRFVENKLLKRGRVKGE